MITNKSAITYRKESPFVPGGLPFIGDDSDHWDIPAKGGHSGGCITGEAMAYAYMRYAATADDPQDASVLQGIVFSLAKKIAALGMNDEPDRADEEASSLRGQICGFLVGLETHLFKHAKKHAKRFTKKVTTEGIERMANRGINLDQAASNAYWNAKIDQVNKEQIFEPKPF